MRGAFGVLIDQGGGIFARHPVTALVMSLLAPRDRGRTSSNRTRCSRRSGLVQPKSEAGIFKHIMISSNDLERARAFYHATFGALGGKTDELNARGRLIYTHEGGRLMITTMIDGKPATAANRCFLLHARLQG